MKIKNQRQFAKEIGIDECTLSRILHKKQRVSKILAYCITKKINENADIKDYFVKVID
jgi:transcriptional regulator with XRE-family HTH domain